MTVGEVFLAAFVGMLFSRLTSPAILKFTRRRGYRKDLKNWRKTLLMLQAVLNEAEEKQLTDKSVRIWLHDLRDLVYDVEDILDEFATSEAVKHRLITEKECGKVQKLITASSGFLSPSAVKFNAGMESKIKKVTARLQDTYEQVSKLGLQKIHESKSMKQWQRTPSTCLDPGVGICGRDDDKKKIIELVLKGEMTCDSNFQVIPIVGMGGVGKTTLAQVVYNSKAVYHFHPKVWVSVSDEFDVTRIAKAILESVTFQPCELKEYNQVQVKLREALAGRRFLLVLDDVWNKNYGLWEALKSPFSAGASGSKIIVTTRCMDVALTIQSVEHHKLEVLSEDDIWLVFVKHAFKDGETGEHLELIRKKVVEKCRGLPLAARSLGGLLRSKPKDEWGNILNRKMWNLPDESDILPVLKMSYHHLPSHLKQCFAYCAVLPKGYEFEEEELVLLWMAEGLIQHHEDSRGMEELGAEYFRELVSRSIFQLSSCNGSLYVMHDLINDLAQWAAGETCFILEDKLEDDMQPEGSRRFRHSSYTRDDYDGIRKFVAFHEAKCLRTFLPFRHGNTSYISSSVLNLLPNLKRLRVLSLSGYNITELPSSIGNLKLLRYLNLSFTIVRSLPESTSSLYNLQTLILRDCSHLIKLPSKIGNLINLRHLDLTNVYLVSEMPLGIKRMKHLQKLSDFFVSKKTGCGIEELMNLNFLRGTLHISRLENVVDAQHARQANLSKKHNLEALMLKWGSDFNDLRNESIEKDVLDMLRPHHMLTELTISSYGGVEFPTWVGDPSFCNMVLLSLENCENCTSLPPLGLLKSLKDLVIMGMSGLRSIGLEFYGEGCSKPFPSLETLHFEQMPEWKDWNSYNDQQEVKIFPRLRKLSILNCSELRGKLPDSLPSLEALVIYECERLLVSVSSFPKLCNLDINGCKEVVCRSMTEFCSLNSIVLSCVLDSRYLTEHFMRGLKRVENLEIVGCEELQTLRQNGVGLLQHLSSLRCLKIKSCSQLVSLGSEDEGDKQLGLPSCLETLKLLDCESLDQPLALQNLTFLTELHIERCTRLVSFVQVGLPSALKELHIGYCDNLICLLEEGKDANISSTLHLEYLCIRNCPSLLCLSSRGKLPASLRHLEIWDCPQLDSIANTFCSTMSLEHIEIRYCENLAALPEGLNRLSHLQVITICNCPNIVSFPEGGLPTTNLRRLYIGWCKKLTLPKRMKHFTSLLELDIHSCPGIVSFPEEGFPTNLTSLLITNLSICQQLFEWGLHRFTSLKRLFITGGCVDVVCFPQDEIGMMLPTSLTNLSIADFPNLQFLSSKGFQNLTFLKELWISDCPKLKFLPVKGLPPSLLELYIHECPLLKQQCKRNTGQEFSKIAHIPCVYIDNQFIYDPEDEE